MALRINFNYEAAVTHTALKTNERLMNKSLLRLSTGLRILNAADDSAGQFIADQLAIVSAGLEQGNRNIQTGISALQIAENSAGQIYNKLKEIYVRAERAANDINDPNARAALQREIDNLIDAIKKIGTDTEYNGIRLLDGTFVSKKIHYGARKDQTVDISIDSLLPKDLGAYLAKGQGARVADGPNSNSDWNQSGVIGANGLSGTSWALDDGDYVDVRGVRVYAGSTTLTFVDAKTLADNINNSEALKNQGIEAKAKNDNLADETFANFDDLYTVSSNATVTGIMLDFWVGGVAVTAAASFSVTIDSNTTSLNKLVEDINTQASDNGVDIRAKIVDDKLYLETGNGETIAVRATVNGDLDGSGGGDVTVHFGKLFEGAGDVTFNSNTTKYFHYVDVGEIDIAGLDTYKVEYSGVSAANAGFNFDLNSGDAAAAKNLNAINVNTNANAEEALLILKKAIQRVDTVRSEIGAVMNNLQAIYDAQKVAKDNTDQAENVIRNVDFAKEMMNFTTMQIRMQSGVAMLGQANTLPQLVLQLLR